MKFIKEKLYFLKRWYVLVFLYPQETLHVEASLDYNEYWKKKKGNVQGGHVRTITQNEKMRAEYVAKIIGNGEPVTIGDIASGPGVIFKYLKDKIQIQEYIGYEHSTYAIEVANSLGMKTVEFDINSDTEIEAIKVADYFLMLEILEHIPNSEKVLTSMYKKAQKGVFFSFPNSGNFLYRLRVLFGKMPAQWIKFPNEHLRFWTYTDLKWWLKALGYSDYQIYCYRGVPYLEKIWPALFSGSFVVFLSKY
jgi:2-polyprenyl-3-methyl-5-hydroxy-6-metoxy-1,4-benzoquinol methylase